MQVVTAIVCPARIALSFDGVWAATAAPQKQITAAMLIALRMVSSSRHSDDQDSFDAEQLALIHINRIAA
jgi:hypothetical protein